MHSHSICVILISIAGYTFNHHWILQQIATIMWMFSVFYWPLQCIDNGDLMISTSALPCLVKHWLQTNSSGFNWIVCIAMRITIRLSNWSIDGTLRVSFTSMFSHEPTGECQSVCKQYRSAPSAHRYLPPGIAYRAMPMLAFIYYTSHLFVCAASSFITCQWRDWILSIYRIDIYRF